MGHEQNGGQEHGQAWEGKDRALRHIDHRGHRQYPPRDRGAGGVDEGEVENADTHEQEGEHGQDHHVGYGGGQKPHDAHGHESRDDETDTPPEALVGQELFMERELFRGVLHDRLLFVAFYPSVAFY